MKRNFLSLFLFPVFLISIFFVSSALALPYPSLWDNVVFERAGGNANGGGAFKMSYAAPPSLPTAASPSLITFCLELNEYIEIATFGYKIWDISYDAIQGGVGGATGGKDTISYETAYVYTNFLAGNYSSRGTDDQVKNAVQAVIWQLEEETINIASGEDYTTIATTILGEAETAVFIGDWTGWGNVRVANIGKNTVWDPYKQSMLTVVPEPTTILLSGLGLLGLGCFLRRKSKKA